MVLIRELVGGSDFKASLAHILSGTEMELSNRCPDDVDRCWRQQVLEVTDRKAKVVFFGY